MKKQRFKRILYRLSVASLSWLIPFQVQAEGVPQEALVERATALDLPTALQVARQNYDSQWQHWQVASQQASIQQAQQGPNPTLQLSFENLPSLKGEGSEINLQWQQGINPAQQAQIALASQSYRVSGFGLALQQLTLEREVTQAFYALLVGQAYVKSLQQLEQVAAQRVALLEAQYAQGKILLAEYNRARLAQAELQLQQQNSQLQQQKAQRQLAQYLNRDTVMVAKGPLVIPLSPELFALSEQTVKAQLQQHPLLQQDTARQDQAQQNKAVQQALVWQNASWGVGLRVTPGAADVGALAQVNVPLPVWHQNQGGILASQYQHDQAETQVKNTWFTLNNHWQNSLAQYQQVQTNLKAYQEQLLPLARENVKLSQTAYQYGKQSYLELLDAQRSLIALEQSYLQTWGQYHQIRAELAFLLSRPVP